MRAEVKGSLELGPSSGSLTLTAKADRMEIGQDGALTVIDYKTGVLPSGAQVEAGLAPQLPLEAAIAARRWIQRTRGRGANGACLPAADRW